MKKNNKWVVYIYIVFLVTILLTVISFVSNYIIWNLDIYNTIKMYFSLYWNQIWINEKVIIDYYDNPKNSLYFDTKYYDKNNFISRYKDFIEYNLDSKNVFQLSLTSQDEEYNNNLNKLSYIDLYWNTSTNKCDITLSFLKWQKDKIWTILNNKKEILYTDNRVLVKWIIWSDNKTINLFFSTWAYYNSWGLVLSNFLSNSWIMLSLSWSLDKYDLTFSWVLNSQLNNLLSIKENQVKDVFGRVFESENILLKSKNNIYTNRYRLKDSFWYMDKLNYEYKLLIKANNDCPFLIQWYDFNNNLIKLPDNVVSWELKLEELKTKVDIVKKVKVWNIELSNYLYKFY